MAESTITRQAAALKLAVEAMELAAVLPCDWESIGLPCRPGCVTYTAHAALTACRDVLKGEAI